MATFAASYTLLWILVLFQGLIALVLVHRLAELRHLASIPPAASTRIPVGDAVPDFSAVDARAKAPLVGSQLRGTCKALLFLSPDCGVCRRLATDLARTAAPVLRDLVVACSGTREESSRLVQTLPDTVRVLHDNQGDMTGTFGLSNFPVVVSISAHWTVAGYSHPSDRDQVLACLHGDVAVVPALSGNDA